MWWPAPSPALDHGGFRIQPNTARAGEGAGPHTEPFGIAITASDRPSVLAAVPLVYHYGIGMVRDVAAVVRGVDVRTPHDEGIAL